jgi:hypothetical protein
MIEYLKRRFLPSHRPLCVDCKFYRKVTYKNDWHECTKTPPDEEARQRYVGAFQGPLSYPSAWAQRSPYIGECKPWGKYFEPKAKAQGIGGEQAEAR